MARIGFVFVRRVGATRLEALFNRVIAAPEDMLSANGSSLIVCRVEDRGEELVAPQPVIVERGSTPTFGSDDRRLVGVGDHR